MNWVKRLFDHGVDMRKPAPAPQKPTHALYEKEDLDKYSTAALMGWTIGATGTSYYFYPDQMERDQ